MCSTGRLIRQCVALTSVALAACATTQQSAPRETRVEVQQWRSVESDSPLVAAAFLQSLLALTEESPEEVARARRQAFDLARRAGVITIQRQVCAPCEPPKAEADLRRHMACVIGRINCLRPP